MCEFDLKETFHRQWQRSGRSGKWERQLSMGGEDGGRGTRTWKWESESEKGKVRKWERQLSMGGEAEGRGMRTFAHGFHCVCLQTFRHWYISGGWICVCLVFIKTIFWCQWYILLQKYHSPLLPAHYKNFFQRYLVMNTTVADKMVKSSPNLDKPLDFSLLSTSLLFHGDQYDHQLVRPSWVGKLFLIDKIYSSGVKNL